MGSDAERQVSASETQEIDGPFPPKADMLAASAPIALRDLIFETSTGAPDLGKTGSHRGASKTPATTIILSLLNPAADI